MRTISLVLAATVTMASMAFARTPPMPIGRGMARIEGGTFRPLIALPRAASVRIATFALDTIAVSEAAFRGVNGSKLKPATHVSWFQAEAYCKARGARLPTTDEWEYAARASEKARDASANRAFRQRVLSLALRAHDGAQSIGSGLRNVWGVRDLHGGVNEWTEDFAPVDAHAHHASSAKHTATCATGALQTADTGDYAAFLRYGFRSAANRRMTSGSIGFRCAASL